MEIVNSQDDKKKFFIKHQADTAGKAGIELLKLLGNTENLFILSDDPKEIKKNAEAYEKLLADTLEIFTNNNVGLTNYPFVFGGIKSIVEAVHTHMSNHATNLQKEIAARTIGTKNPLDGKYDQDHATHADLIKTVSRLREEQGNVPNAEDYYTLIPKEEGIVSPLQPNQE